MTDNSPQPDLDSLLKKWAQAELATDVGRDCPPLSVLLYHENAGETLGQYTEHVSSCSRCEKRLTLIRTEITKAHGLQSVGSSGKDRSARSVKPILFRIGVLAAAASIALVLFIYPSPDDRSFDDHVAVFSWSAHAALSGGATRGDDIVPIGGDSPEEPAWVTQALADPRVKSALTAMHDNDGPILSGLLAGALTIDPEGRVTIAPGARAMDLSDTPEDERQAIDNVVDALLQHLPAATKNDHPAVRRALLRWRAENVFGGLNHSAP